MFEFIRKHTRVALFVLVLLIIPSFVFFGIEGYTRFSDGTTAPVASVNGANITQAELDFAHREQVEMLRRQMPNIDTRLLDTPQMKANTLDGIVRERVLVAAAHDLGYVTSDARLERAYRTDGQFESFRNPDGSLNVAALESVLAMQGMSKHGFEQRVRQDLAVRQVQRGIAGTVIGSEVAAASAIDAYYQQREAQVLRFNASNYLSQVKPTDADIEAYYKDPAHAAEFRTAETVDIEYVVLDLEAITKSIQVSEDDLRKYYAENESRYTSPQERRVSHILVKAGADQPAEERRAAKEKAQELLAAVTQAPASFADVARKNSQDAGSAERGGEVDIFIGRGDTEKAYEDGLFALKKPGDLSPVLETAEGFYILQLKAVRGGETRSYESVRAEIEAARRTELAHVEYARAATEFSNLVYEQSDSLKPVSDALKLSLRTAQGVTRAPAPGAEGPLASPKLLEALFDAETLRSKRNIDAMETAPSTLAAARVVQHHPSVMQPLADVRAGVQERVVARQAAQLARAAGEARLAAAREALGNDLGVPVQLFSRAQGGNSPSAVVDAVLRAPSNSLPAASGVDLGAEGYAVVRVVKVIGRDPVASDASRVAAQYAQVWGAAEAAAYYAALKTRFKAQVKSPPVAANVAAD